MSTLELLAYTAPVIAVLGFLLSPWGVPVLSFLTGTRVGRYASGLAAVAYLAFVAYSAVYQRGRRAGSAGAIDKVVRANAEAAAARAEVDAASSTRDDDELRRRLAKWTRPAPVILLALSFGLGGCAHKAALQGSLPDKPKDRGGSFCETAKPMRPTSGSLAAMSHDELVAMDAHNSFGARRCGWTP